MYTVVHIQMWTNADLKVMENTKFTMYEFAMERNISERLARHFQKDLAEYIIHWRRNKGARAFLEFQSQKENVQNQ